MCIMTKPVGTITQAISQNVTTLAGNTRELTGWVGTGFFG